MRGLISSGGISIGWYQGEASHWRQYLWGVVVFEWGRGQPIEKFMDVIT